MYASSVPERAQSPDFQCRTHDGDVRGVELTQVVQKDRARASARFQRVKRAVMSTDRNRFRHLRGHIVYASVDEVADDDPAVDPAMLTSNLVRALYQHDPRVSAGLGANLPQQAPSGVSTPFSGGVITSAPLQTDPRSPFSNFMHFELAVAQPDTVTETTAWRQFTDRIRDHDDPGVDDIIVSAEPRPQMVTPTRQML